MTKSTRFQSNTRKEDLNKRHGSRSQGQRQSVKPAKAETRLGHGWDKAGKKAGKRLGKRLGKGWDTAGKKAGTRLGHTAGKKATLRQVQHESALLGTGTVRRHRHDGRVRSQVTAPSTRRGERAAFTRCPFDRCGGPQSRSCASQTRAQLTCMHDVGTLTVII